MMPNLTPGDLHVLVPVGTERHSFSQNQDSDFKRNQKRRKRKIALRQKNTKMLPFFDGTVGVKSMPNNSPAPYKIQKAARFFSASSRRKNAKKRHALPDGSYPIPDADSLRRAAILARSGHGDVAGAKALIARRSRELGVKNPLSKTPVSKSLAGLAEFSGGIVPVIDRLAPFTR